MTNEDICCPEFDPKPWDEKTHKWQNRLFLKDEVRQFMHMPINFGAVVTRMWEKVERAKVAPSVKDFLLLSYDPSPWKSELYMSITSDIPGEKTAQLSGEFITKVFDGPFSQVPKWYKQMEEFIASKGKKIDKQYFYFTSCPKCAKKYGHNYVVAFAKIGK